MSPKKNSEQKNLNIKSMGNGGVPKFSIYRERVQGKIEFLTFSYFHWDRELCMFINTQACKYTSLLKETCT